MTLAYSVFVRRRVQKVQVEVVDVAFVVAPEAAPPLLKLDVDRSLACPHVMRGLTRVIGDHKNVLWILGPFEVRRVYDCASVVTMYQSLPTIVRVGRTLHLDAINEDLEVDVSVFPGTHAHM
jgi:hypothetical protein